MSGDSFWRQKNMSDDDIVWLVEYTAKVQAVAAKQAAKAERARIVDWLRRARGLDEDDWLPALMARAVEAKLADYIERGDHLGADDE